MFFFFSTNYHILNVSHFSLHSDKKKSDKYSHVDGTDKEMLTSFVRIRGNDFGIFSRWRRTSGSICEPIKNKNKNKTNILVCFFSLTIKFSKWLVSQKAATKKKNWTKWQRDAYMLCLDRWNPLEPTWSFSGDKDSHLVASVQNKRSGLFRFHAEQSYHSILVSNKTVRKRIWKELWKNETCLFTKQQNMKGLINTAYTLRASA